MLVLLSAYSMLEDRPGCFYHSSYLSPPPAQVETVSVIFKIADTIFLLPRREEENK